ncbi:MAG: glycosyltransferase [Candidatus Hydrogenedens sp.]|nr:glycosyltransferase [Candidatus Hydrogenedens sp.]
MSRRLNLLYLIRTWQLGGSYTIIRLLLKYLPEDEFNIVTVPYDSPGTGDADFVRSVEKQGGRGIAPERIPWKSRSNWYNARRTVQDLIKKYDIDVLHAHDTLSNVLVGIERRYIPVAAVASPYGWWEAPWNIKAKINHYVEKHYALPRFDRVYTVSQDMKRKIMQGPTREERIRVIHTGIDLSQFDHTRPRAEVRAEFGFGDDALVVGTVSRLYIEKGHRHLLEAAAALRDSVPQLRLLIVGTGDQREPLERQAEALGIRDRVVFTGFYEHLPDALSAMDIFAQPSVDHEGFPTAVLEAQGAGKPVVASDIGGTHETMNVGETGLLVPPKDSAALADALAGLAAEPDRRARMAAAARPWIERSFTRDQMMAQMAAMYREAHEAYRAR